MKKRYQRWKCFAFLIPSLAGVSVFVFIPFWDVVRRSFMSTFGDTFIGLQNYRSVFTNTAFKLAAGNTGRFLILCVPSLKVISLLLANIVYHRNRSSNPVIRALRKNHIFDKLYSQSMQFYRRVCLLPMAVPVASLVFVWNMLFHRNGLINSYLGFSEDWLHSSSAFAVLTVSFLWKNTGYYVVLWLSGLENIPESLYEAAELDGAGTFSKFYHITLPGLKPMTSAVLILALTNAFKVYRECYLLAGEYPDKSIYMIQHIFYNWFRDMAVEKIAAGAVVTVCIFTVIVFPFRKKGGGNLETLYR